MKVNKYLSPHFNKKYLILKKGTPKMETQGSYSHFMMVFIFAVPYFNMPTSIDRGKFSQLHGAV